MVCIKIQDMCYTLLTTFYIIQALHVVIINSLIHWLSLQAARLIAKRKKEAAEVPTNADGMVY